MADRTRVVVNLPWTRHQATTRFLRVPVVDWPAVRMGLKAEFRTRPREGSRLLKVPLPTPIVAYSWTKGKFGEPSAKLMVLVERRYEPLIELSRNPEALAKEGFDSYEQFRIYWRRRTNSFRPMERVWVWGVRPFAQTDVESLGVKMFWDLYGEFAGDFK